MDGIEGGQSPSKTQLEWALKDTPVSIDTGTAAGKAFQPLFVCQARTGRQGLRETHGVAWSSSSIGIAQAADWRDPKTEATFPRQTKGNAKSVRHHHRGWRLGGFGLGPQ